MKRIPDENCVGICGLFCGTCVNYPEKCHGCHSDFVHGPCVNCRHGFRDCSGERGISYCFECADFPCERLKAFSTQHIENGICHHENVLSDLLLMKEHGVKAWVEEQTSKNLCGKCNELIYWMERDSHQC